MINYPNIGHTPSGRRRKFQITCNGNPFAGFDDEVDANKALSMYSDERKAQVYNFQLYDGDSLIRSATSGKKASKS